VVLRNSIGIFVNTPIVSIRSDVSNHFNCEFIVIIIRGSLVYLTHYVSQRPDRGDVNVGMSSESPLSSPHHTMPLSPSIIETFDFKRGQDEYELVDIAISLCAAIRVYKERKGVVNLDFFLDKMDENLVRHLTIAHSSILTQALQANVCAMYDPYPDGVKLPLFHPIIGYLARLWDATMNKNEFYDAINLSEVAAKCGEAKTMKGYDEFKVPDLSPLVKSRIRPEHRWWLSPAALGMEGGDGDAGTSRTTLRGSGIIGILTHSQIWLMQMQKTLRSIGLTWTRTARMSTWVITSQHLVGAHNQPASVPLSHRLLGNHLPSVRRSIIR
jgi:hypothetical protein